MSMTRAVLFCGAVLGILAGGCTWNGQRGIDITTGDGAGGNGGTGIVNGLGGTIPRPDSGIRVDAGQLDPDAACNVQMYTVNSTPDLLILLDKSRSMLEDPSTGMNCTTPGCTKWDQVTAAINQVVTATPDAWWGLKFFGDDDRNTCGVGTGAAVQPAANSAAAIATAISMNSPSSSTPTRAAVTNAGAYLRGLTDMNQRFIVLATDGLPTCGSGAMSSDAMGAETAVATQASMGTRTFVIGIATSGDATATATLTTMAANGMTGQPYFPVANTTDLVTALGAIQSAAKSCIFPLGQVPPNPANVRVNGDGVKIPQDLTNTNGWNYTSTTTIQLYGQACDDYVNDVVKTVAVILGCEVPIPG